MSGTLFRVPRTEHRTVIPPKFNYYAPDSLQDALALISEHQEDGKILSGGHSLIPLLKLSCPSLRC